MPLALRASVRPQLIEKRLLRTPNLSDYDAERAAFGWAKARALLDGLPQGAGLNIAYEALDRHARGENAGKVALRWLPKSGAPLDLTYRELTARASRFANLLARLGVAPGARVFALAGRIPELYVAALGTLRQRAVFCPLFSAFGPEPMQQRLALGDGRALVTTRRTVRSARSRRSARALPGLEARAARGLRAGRSAAPRTRSIWMRCSRVSRASTRSRPRAPRIPRCCTSRAARPASRRARCTSTKPSSRTVATARFALDLQAGDVLLVHRRPRLGDGHFLRNHRAARARRDHRSSTRRSSTPRRWYETLERERVSVWYTAPTAVRMLMRAGSALARERPTCPRCASSPASASHSTRRR